jgi:hypothetical protein
MGETIAVGPELYRLVGIFAAGGEAVPGLAAETVFVPHTPSVRNGRCRGAGAGGCLVVPGSAGVRARGASTTHCALLVQPGIGADGVEWTTPETLLRGVRRWQRAIGWSAGAGGALGLLLGRRRWPACC